MKEGKENIIRFAEATAQVLYPVLVVRVPRSRRQSTIDEGKHRSHPALGPISPLLFHADRGLPMLMPPFFPPWVRGVIQGPCSLTHLA